MKRQCSKPVELLIILAAIAGSKHDPFRPSAPSQRPFNKGVDYVGDIARFEREFALDVGPSITRSNAFGCDKIPADGSLRQTVFHYPAIHHH